MGLWTTGGDESRISRPRDSEWVMCTFDEVQTLISTAKNPEVQLENLPWRNDSDETATYYPFQLDLLLWLEACLLGFALAQDHSVRFRTSCKRTREGAVTMNY